MGDLGLSIPKDTCDRALQFEARKYALEKLLMLKAHCRGCDWLVVILKSKTKLWPSSNYQTLYALGSYFVLRIRGIRSLSSSWISLCIKITEPCLILFFLIVLFILSASRQCAFKEENFMAFQGRQRIYSNSRSQMLLDDPKRPSSFSGTFDYGPNSLFAFQNQLAVLAGQT